MVNFYIQMKKNDKIQTQILRPDMPACQVGKSHSRVTTTGEALPPFRATPRQFAPLACHVKQSHQMATKAHDTADSPRRRQPLCSFHQSAQFSRNWANFDNTSSFPSNSRHAQLHLKFEEAQGGCQRSKFAATTVQHSTATNHRTPWICRLGQVARGGLCASMWYSLKSHAKYAQIEPNHAASTRFRVLASMA